MPRENRLPDLIPQNPFSYHAFGIRGYLCTRSDYQDGQMIFTIHQGVQIRCQIRMALS